MKSLVVLSLAILASGAWSQDVSQTVTFEAPAGRASLVLKKLGKQAGIVLETSNQTKDEVILVRVKDAPLKEVMSRIAKVSNADWKMEGTGFRLIRSSERQNETIREEIAARAGAIDGVLKAAIDQQAKLPAWDESQAAKLADRQRIQRESMSRGGGPIRVVKSSELINESPGGRVTIALVAALGAWELAKIGPNERIVYALQPTRMQKRLPANSAGLIRRFIDQQWQFSEAFKKRQPDDGRVMIIKEVSGPEMGSGDPSLGVGQAILVLQRFNDSIWAQLSVADSNGDPLANASWNVAPSPPPLKADDEPGIALSAEGKEFSKFAIGTGSGSVKAVAGRSVMIRMATSGSGGTTLTFGGGDGTPPVPISDALRTRLLRPEEFDPQSLVLGDALAAAAQSKGKNLVASLPDSAIMPLAGRFAGGKVSPTALLGSVGDSIGLRVDTSDLWIQVAPKFPATARVMQINRPLLGQLLRTIQNEGYARLSHLATFALGQHKTASGSDFDGYALRLINAGAAQSAQMALKDAPTLRLFGSLTPAQQNTLVNGGSIPIAQLTQSQRSFIATDVFTSIDGPQLAPSGNNLPGRFLAFGSVNGERTHILPDGLPPHGTLSLKIDRQSAAFATDSQSGVSGIVTPSTLASSQFSGENPDLAALGNPPKYDQFQPAEQTSYTFHFTFAPNISMVRGLNDAWFDLKAPRVALDGLPVTFKNQLKATLQTLRTGFGGIKLGSPGAGRIPPAP